MIQVYHGDESKHLIIFVNGEILKIAFEQSDSAVHSFLIEQQLLELEIKQENGTYSYVVTPQAPPPIEPTESTFGRHFWIPLIFLLLILNLAFYLNKSLNIG